MRVSPERQLKIDLAAFVASHLIHNNDRLFVASGTTAAVAGLEILCRYPEVKVHTHSIPLAWHFMEFMQRNFLSASASVEMLGGSVDPTTGIVRNANIGKIASTVFLYAPHGIGAEAITGNRDVIYLKEAWKAHDRIILLATGPKLLRTGTQIIKYIGHIKKESSNKKRVVELVVPASIADKNKSEEERRHINMVLGALASAGVTIHKAPQCRESPWLDYFSDAHRSF